MKKFLYVALLAVMQLMLLGVTTNSHAQTKTNRNYFVCGHVVDAETKERIPYSTVIIEGTTIGAVADDAGHFNLKNLALGEYVIEASMAGYSPTTKIIKVTKDTSADELTFELKLDVLMLDQVIVSASRTETTRRNSPTLVSVMPADIFDVVCAPTLADALTFNTGIRVDNNCQNCGFTQVRINGLEGNYSQILIDSRPIFSSLTSVYGLESIPAAMVDRVEVVRGGGSALFGSSAIAGTINIITKTPERSSAEVATNLTVTDGTTDSNTTANATYVTEDGKAGFTMFAQSRNRQAYDANGDGFSEIPVLESKTIGLRTFFKTSDYSKLSLAYDATSDFRRGGDNLDEPMELAAVAESAAHDINAATVNFDLFSHDYGRKLNLYSSVMNTKRESYYNGAGTTYDLTIATGAQFTTKVDNCIFMPSEFLLGVEHVFNELTDEHYNYTLSSTGDEDDAFQFTDDLDAYINRDNYYSTYQKVNTFSLYAQNEWKNEKFGFLIGARADYNDFMDKVVISPRANIRYNVTDKINLRASYASGFRSPQLFDEDLHIMIVQGEQSVIENDPDLKEEKSHSFSFSADTYQNIGKVSTNFLVEGFYTVLQDAFSLSETSSNGDVLVQTRTNSAGAKVYGASFEARAVIPNVVDFQAGFTVQRSKYNESEERTNGEATNLEVSDVDDLEFAEADDQRSILRSPDTYGYFLAKFPISDKLRFTSTATYTGSMLVEHVMGGETNSGEEYEYTEYINSQSFFDMNLTLDYEFMLSKSVRMTLTGGLLNAFNSYQSDFDEGADRDAGFVYGPMAPRRWTLGVKMAF